MKKKTKIYTIGACCVAAGIMLSAVGIAAGGWPGVSISATGIHSTGNRPDKKAHVLEKTKLEEFNKVSMDIDYADLEIIPSDDYYIEYRLSGSDGEPEYKIDNDSLIFREKPKNGNFMFFNFGNFSWSNDYNEKYYVKLYMPEDKMYEKIQIYNDSGDLNAGILKAEDMSLEVEYGDIGVESLNSKTLAVSLDSGDFKAKEVYTDTLELNNDYGKVIVGELTADSANIQLESGKTAIDKSTINNLTLDSSYGGVKLGSAHISDGSIDMESGKLEILGAVLGNVEVNSAYGDVAIQLEDNPETYAMKLKTEYGSVNVPFDGRYISEDDEERFEMSGKGGKSLEISCESGDITVK